MKNHFSRTLIFLRRTRNLSQTVFAKKFGVTQSQISFYERGISEIGLHHLEKMLKILNFDLVLFMLIAQDFSEDKPILSIQQYISIVESGKAKKNELLKSFIKSE